MDFLRNHAHLAGGDTRKTPNLANHGIRQEGKTPPHANPSQSTKSQTLSILSNQNTHREFLTKFLTLRENISYDILRCHKKCTPSKSL